MVKKNTRLRKWRRKVIGKTPGSIAFNLLLYFFLAAFACCTLYPFVYVIIESLKTVVPTNNGVPEYTYNLSAYVYVLTKIDGFLRTFVWSIIVSLVYAFLHVFFTLLSAYPLTRKDLMGRNVILKFMVVTMLFGGGMIPWYLLMKDLGFFNNPLIYFIPGLISAGDIIIARNFLSGISPSLGESARIDGAGEYRVFLQIYMPLSKPIMATLGLWAFVGKWNDWMTGVLYMQQKPELALIQTFLRRVLNTTVSQSEGGADAEILNLGTSIRMAVIVVGVLPVVVAYPFVQKHFVKGVMLGSVKG